MICNKCGRQIGIEDKMCPYCGTENEFALKHDKNMRSYGGKFDSTSKNVIDTAKRTGKFGTKAVIMVILILVIVATRIVSSYNYADPDDGEDKKRAKLAKNTTENIAQIDDLLEKGQYVEAYEYMKEHGVLDSDAAAYKELDCIRYLSDDYCKCIEYLEEMAYCSPDPDCFDNFESYSYGFSLYVDNVFNGCKSWKESDSNGKYIKYVYGMETQLRDAMKVYLGMDDQDIEEFLELSEAKRGVKLEEALHK